MSRSSAEGFEAGCAGAPAGACPYSIKGFNSGERSEWMRGWKMGSTPTEDQRVAAAAGRPDPYGKTTT